MSPYSNLNLSPKYKPYPGPTLNINHASDPNTKMLNEPTYLMKLQCCHDFQIFTNKDGNNSNWLIILIVSKTSQHKATSTDSDLMTCVSFLCIKPNPSNKMEGRNGFRGLITANLFGCLHGLMLLLSASLWFYSNYIIQFYQPVNSTNTFKHIIYV